MACRIAFSVMSGHRDVEEALDAHSTRIALSQEERRAIQNYQADHRIHTVAGTFHWHQLINRFLRDDLPSDLDDPTARSIARMVNAIQSAITKSRIPVAVTAWRGVRQPATVARLRSILNDPLDSGTLVVLNGMVSCSLSRSVAERFGAPPPTLLFEMAVPISTTGLWVPPWGDPRLKGQKELLLDDGTELALRAVVQESDELTRVVCEVAR